MKRFLLSSFLFTGSLFFAQTELVFVFFKDKPNKAEFYSNPLSELSQKSLDRRTNLGIALNDQDAPIEQSYIDAIEDLIFEVKDQSKWLNGVAVNATSEQIAQLEALSFVDHVESFVKNPSGGKLKPSERKNKFENIDAKTDFDYGAGNAQIEQINLKPLHEQGFTGAGITIAVFDTGFPTVNTGSGYARLRNNGQIKGGYNFIDKDTNLYDLGFNSHGSYCLGVIGGYLTGEYVGSAPDADFYLYVTESGPQEIPEEELYWIQAAEEADRVGVDIISASLGYGDFFDDTRYNYTYEDMTGSRSFVARGAQIAAEKGILVHAANGNEAYSAWHYLVTPADNEKVFSIGAVDSSGNSSYFSSFGPNYLGAVKPDVSARGSSTAMVYNNSQTNSSGTSFSTPLAAGGTASFLSAIPKTISREEVKEKLRNTASLAPEYDDQMGYGILNFGAAFNQFLDAKNQSIKQKFTVYPNPNNGTFFVNADADSGIKIFDMSGKQVFSGKLTKGKNELQLKVASGTYLLTSELNGTSISEKISVK